MAIELARRSCAPCRGDTPPLAPAQIERLREQVPTWIVREGKLVKTMTFRDFAAAMAFLGRVAAIAEREDHHPDFCVHYRVVDFTLWTHAIGGLSENDFIMAAKLDDLERTVS